MDPDKALNDLFEAFKKGDRDVAVEMMEGLISWIENGGFIPDINKVAIYQEGTR